MSTTTPRPDHPHRRLNPLTGEWVLVSAERTNRPWQGQEEGASEESRPAYDPECYLCPGNERAGTAQNPDYDTTFVFTNDFAALQPDTPEDEQTAHPLLRAHAQPGTCRVICFSPRHDLTLAEMDHEGLCRVIDLWAEQLAELTQTYRWVQVFENKGEQMGASNPHPHGQIWATTTLPNQALTEDRYQREYRDREGRALLVDYAELEAERRERVVAETPGWLAVVPYWAVWPFELLVLPRDPVRRLPDLTDEQRGELARLLRQVLMRYDNLFNHAFPYSMGWHQTPGAAGASGDDEHWQLHAHFYPPLLRSATVRKFMVGYELLANVQRNLTAEEAAERLRDQPGEHYRAGR